MPAWLASRLRGALLTTAGPSSRAVLLTNEVADANGGRRIHHFFNVRADSIVYRCAHVSAPNLIGLLALGHIRII